MSTPTAEQAALLQGSTFVWHELYVPDLDAAVEFYTALGFGSTEMPMGEMGTYRMLTRDGKPVCGMMTTKDGPAAGAPSHWAVYISVDDVDATVKACEDKGAKLVVPAMDVPTVGRMAMLKDPQDAHFWVFKSSGM
jgi:predicted enzyme related to lactoylglutathione lyase